MRQKILASRHARRLLNDTKVRFFLTGIFNTSVDFGIYNILIFLALSAEWASIVSTSVAMCLSYALNKTVVFKAGGRFISSEAIRFFAVTIFGLWVVQTLIIHWVGQALHGLLPSEWLAVNVAKVAAVAASTVWNYVWYSRFVFKKGSAK